MIKRALLIVACVCLAAEVLGSQQHADTFPAFVWSNQPYFQSEQQRSQVSYQVFNGLTNIIPAWLSAALSLDKLRGSGHTHFQWDQSLPKPELLVVVVGKEVAALSSESGSAAVSQLKQLLDGATSSLSVPYIRHQLSHGRTADEEIIAILEEHKVDFQTVNCGSAAADSFLQQALGRDALAAASETSIVLVCSKAGAAEQQQELGEVARLAQESGLAYQLMYVSAPGSAQQQAQVPASRRRSLLAAASGFGPYTECGHVCQTQVRWLEGIIALVLISMAALSGLCCMYALNTPTRFQTVKEGGRSD